MNLFIPDIGTTFILSQDWTFTLYYEYRNIKLLSKLKSMGLIDSDRKNQVITLPKGLAIKTDRIYVRKGLPQFSSLTFTVPATKNKLEKFVMPLNNEFKGSKFWVKLHECNGIDVEPYHGNDQTHALFNEFYRKIESECISQFGVEKCTMLLAKISKLMGPGQNITNLKTNLGFDQYLTTILSKMEGSDEITNYLRGRMISEIRDFKINSLLE